MRAITETLAYIAPIIPFEHKEPLEKYAKGVFLDGAKIWRLSYRPTA